MRRLGEASDRRMRACYRYRTSALVGPWRREPARALDDAVKAGLVDGSEAAPPRWRVAGEIEQSVCARGSPCGGIYPPA